MQIDISFIETHLWIVSALVSFVAVLNVSAGNQRKLLIVLLNTAVVTVLFTRWWLGLLVWAALQNTWWGFLIWVPGLLGTITCLWPWSRVNRNSRANNARLYE
jgi:hypothetical protein